MKKLIATSALAAFAIVAAQAQGEDDAAPVAPMEQGSHQADLSGWTRPLGTDSAPRAGLAAEAAPAPEEMDVVDAHWMALTMWGEGRGEGEAGMRAVGHVIHNRWLAGRGGGYVTGTVSEALQFSCWNENDPNRAKLLNIEDLRPGSTDHRLWLQAKRLSAEILSGRSADPTGGALFYHTTAVQPDWSTGIEPVAQIGDHLFFRTAA